MKPDKETSQKEALTEETLTESDTALIDRFQKGEEEAFSELVRRYQEAIYFMALRMVGTHEEADDLAQQTFINAFRAMDRFERRSSFKTWLYQIVINLGRNYLRDRARRPKMEEAEDRNDRLQDKSPSQIDRLLNQESSHQLKTAIASLPDQQRLTLMLRVFGEQSYENIANILGCFPGTARANYHHAIIGLKKIMTGGTE